MAGRDWTCSKPVSWPQREPSGFVHQLCARAIIRRRFTHADTGLPAPVVSLCHDLSRKRLFAELPVSRLSVPVERSGCGYIQSTAASALYPVCRGQALVRNNSSAIPPAAGQRTRVIRGPRSQHGHILVRMAAGAAGGWSGQMSRELPWINDPISATGP